MATKNHLWVAARRLLGPGTIFEEGQPISDYYLKAQAGTPLAKWIQREKDSKGIVQAKKAPADPKAPVDPGSTDPQIT